MEQLGRNGAHEREHIGLDRVDLMEFHGGSSA